MTLSYTVPATGNYTFGFGVVDTGVNTIKSGLLIDNLNYSPVPEPRTNVLLLALGTGLGGLVVLRRRKALKCSH